MRKSYIKPILEIESLKSTVAICNGEVETTSQVFEISYEDGFGLTGNNKTWKW